MKSKILGLMVCLGLFGGLFADAPPFNQQATKDLWRATADYNSSKVESAIKAGADVNAFLPEKNLLTSVIRWSIFLKKEERDDLAAKIVKMLIDAGADLNQIDDTEDTPLIKAAFNNLPLTAKILIDAGAEVDAQNVLGTTALIGAIFNNSLPIAEMLINAGASVDIQEYDGRTPLMLALSEGDKELITMFINADFKIQRERSYKRSLVHAPF